MSRILTILLATAFYASAQTATNRCAVDTVNRAVSLRDFVPAGDWDTNGLLLWLPFLVPPTNSTTYEVGDCSPNRAAVSQATTAARPVWTNGAMSFDGTNDWLGFNRLSGTAGTVIVRYAAVSNGAAFYGVPLGQGITNANTNFISFQVANDSAGGWTNTIRLNISGVRNIGTTNNAVKIVETNTIAWVQPGTGVLIYANGIQQTVISASGGNGPGWFSTASGASHTGGVGRTPIQAGAYQPGRLFWLMVYSRALSSAEVFRISAQGPST